MAQPPDTRKATRPMHGQQKKQQTALIVILKILKPSITTPDEADASLLLSAAGSAEGVSTGAATGQSVVASQT